MIKNVIFDFDGTIADSTHIILKTVDDNAQRYGYVKPGKNRLKMVRTLGTNGLIESLEVPPGAVNDLIGDIINALSQKIDTIEPNPGIIELVSQLNELKLNIAVVTTNTKDTVLKFINKFNMPISVVYDNAGFYGKEHLLKKLCSEHDYKYSETVYIGDEDRDIKAAKNTEIKSVGVTWGLSSKTLLSKFSPDFIAEKPLEILKFIKK